MKFPTPDTIPGPEGMGSQGMPVQTQYRPDTRGTDIAAGVSGAAQGLGQVAGAIGDIADRQMQQNNSVDLSRAEAYRTAQYLDIQNNAAKDNNYAEYGKNYPPLVDAAVAKAGDLIRDPRMREKWLADQESGKAQMLDAIHDRGVQLHDDFNRAGLESSLADNARLISDPTVPQEVRDKARKDMTGSIDMGVHTGLVEPGKAVELRDKYLKGSDNELAKNTAELDILANPQRAMIDLAIPTTGDAHSSLMAAQQAVNGGPPALEFSLARTTAHLLGDANFPDDPKLATAYLSDPEKAAQYAEAAQAVLTDRYKGDLTAAVVAMDPKGGTELADKWVASGKKDWVLPRDVRGRVADVMGRMAVEQPYQRIPITTDPGVDVNSIDVSVLGRFERLQSQFGRAIPIAPADPSRPAGQPQLDIDVKALDNDQRSKLIEMASSMGFTGIGVGKDTLTLDTGPLRAWGPNGKSDSVPAWASGAIDQHTSGATAAMPTLYSGVADQYKALTFDQRLALYGQAKAALADKNVGMRSSLETVSTNAPAAVAATGKYDGDVPNATQFVQAYGAAEGIQKYRAFEADMDTSRTMFGMRTMTNQDIINAMHLAVPQSSGNDAANQAKSYDAISKAGTSVLSDRAKDPAGYVLSAFPQVAAAYDAAQKDRSQFPAALTAVLEAEKQLGFDNPVLLPKALAAQAADAFKDKTLPAQQRIAAVAGLVLAVPDPEKQDMIFAQLVGEGLPAMTSGALNAMRRGDTGGAAALMRAALFDPDTLKVKLPDGQSDEDIKASLMEDVFAPGKVGDVVYGVVGASTDNLEQMKGASDLMFNDVKQRLVDGSAGGNLDKAIELAKSDMFGDDQVVTGKGGGPFGIGAGVGLKVTAPADVAPDQLRRGFGNLAPSIRGSLRSTILGGGLPGAPMEAQLGMQWSVDNYVDAAMSEGYFANGHGGFVYIDPGTMSPVPGPNGQALVFSLQDVLAASSGVNFSGPPDARIGR